MADYSYRDVRHLARWAIWACGLTIVLLFVCEATYAYYWVVLGDVMEGRFSSHAALIGALRSAASDSQLASYSVIASFLLTYGLFFIWLYRASANAHAMGADLSHGAGFSVGMFFIPGLNLFLPPMMMSEVARAGINASSWRAQPKSLLVPLWWTLQLITSIGGFALAFSAPVRGASIPEFRTFFVEFLVFRLFGILHYLVIAMLMWKVSADQRRQREEFSPAQAAAIFS